MKVHLMFADKDFDASPAEYIFESTLFADLEITTLLEAMARKDKSIWDSCRAALLQGMLSMEEITYRQEVLKDCIANPNAFRELYSIAVNALEQQRRSWYWISRNHYISSRFHNAVELLSLLVGEAKKLRTIANEHSNCVKSEGMKTFCEMLSSELDDEYFSLVNEHLSELRFRDGVIISAELGNYNQGIRYTLRRKSKKKFWRRWAFAPSYTIAPRDDAGAKDISKRRDRAQNEGANILAQSAQHVLDFITVLRDELAFYIGCLNLHETMAALGMPICYPQPLGISAQKRDIDGLYDLALALHINQGVVCNTLYANNTILYIITGANQGGKSTFLRSIGQAQIMMQSGIFVAAKSFVTPMRNGVYTHFKKEEDVQLKSGKLDEELVRMNTIADYISSGALMLFNESFSSTNEREGSEINRQIVYALVENDIEVFSVTHLYTFAEMLYSQSRYNIVSLRAERLDDGSRSFKLLEEKPLQTAFGDDLYMEIFGGNSSVERRNII